MSDDYVALEMSMPLDSDGFLRRECPTCQREFKWFYTPEEEGTAAPPDLQRRRAGTGGAAEPLACAA